MDIKKLTAILIVLALSVINLATVTSSYALPSPEDRNLTLKGEASYRYWGFKVYTARLYTPSSTTNVQESLGTFPLRFALTYARDLAAEDFVKSGEAFMRDNPEIQFESLAPTLQKMNALYEDVKEGDTYTIDFEPGKGISLYLNGVHKGTVLGDDFARGYLGIWLSRYSLSEAFTDSITGNA